MTALKQVYKCSICGNIIEVLHAGKGDLICCGQPMDLLQEKTTDVGLEKHVPIVEAAASVTKVKVGSIPHPMDEEHYIEWVEVIDDSKSCRKFLRQGSKPEADFQTGGQKITAREYCSIHGLWKSS